MFKELDNKSKTEIMKKYAKTNKGKKLAVVLDRLLIESIVLFVTSVLIVGGVILADWSLWTLVIAVFTLLFGLLFFIAQLKIRNDEYNKYLEHLNKSEKNKLTKRK